jgi:hypothetical protein
VTFFVSRVYQTTSFPLIMASSFDVSSCVYDPLAPEAPTADNGIRQDQVCLQSCSAASEDEVLQALQSIAYLVGSPLQPQQAGAHQTAAKGSNFTHRDTGDAEVVLCLLSLLEMGVNPGRVAALIEHR